MRPFQINYVPLHETSFENTLLLPTTIIGRLLDMIGREISLHHASNLTQAYSDVISTHIHTSCQSKTNILL